MKRLFPLREQVNKLYNLLIQNLFLLPAKAGKGLQLKVEMEPQLEVEVEEKDLLILLCHHNGKV